MGVGRGRKIEWGHGWQPATDWGWQSAMDLHSDYHYNPHNSTGIVHQADVLKISDN
jgi:hypothetical protein